MPVHHETPSPVLVDADDRQRSALRTTLAILDVEVAEARSLTAAAAQVRLRPPGVVVVGESLSGDPAAFCRDLSIDPRTNAVAVVVVDGAAGGLRQRALRRAGARGVLRGPAGPLELIEIVRRPLHGRPPPPLRAAAGAERGDPPLPLPRD